MSKCQPQAAYAALAKSIQHEWSFFAACSTCPPAWFEDLKNILWSEFWPSLFRGTVSDDEADLFSLPTRMGGMGVNDPMSSTGMRFEASQLGSNVIVDYLMGKD